MSMRAALAELKQVIKRRRRIIADIFDVPAVDVRFTRNRKDDQLFREGFHFGDDQDALDRIHRLLDEISEVFQHDENFLGFTYQYTARSKWVHHVGPRTDVLIKKVDGDMTYVVVSVMFSDPDY